LLKFCSRESYQSELAWAWDVLRLIASGKPNQEMGDELFISARTIANHAANIFSKDGVRVGPIQGPPSGLEKLGAAIGSAIDKRGHGSEKE